MTAIPLANTRHPASAAQVGWPWDGWSDEGWLDDGETVPPAA